MKMTSIIFLAVCLVLGIANAEIIPVQVTATVTSFEDNGPNGGYFGGNISLGDIITMIYTYNTEATDISPGEYTAHYPQEPPNYVNLIIGGYSFTNSETFGISVINSSMDSYQIGANFSDTFLPFFSASMGLSDTTGTVFSDISLPLPNFNLNDFDGGAYLNITSSRNFTITAKVDSITIIPEPATVLLLSIGGLLLRKKIF